MLTRVAQQDFLVDLGFGATLYPLSKRASGVPARSPPVLRFSGPERGTRDRGRLGRMGTVLPLAQGPLFCRFGAAGVGPTFRPIMLEPSFRPTGVIWGYGGTR